LTENNEPTETGATGEQSTEKEQQLVTTHETPFEKSPVVDAVAGLAAGASRSIGGMAAASLLAGSFAQMNKELDEAKKDLKDLRGELSDTKDDLGAAKTQVAVLQERLHQVAQTRHLRNLGITVGTGLIALAIRFYSQGLSAASVLTAVLGALLILLGWLFRPGTGGGAK